MNDLVVAVSKLPELPGFQANDFQSRIDRVSRLVGLLLTTEPYQRRELQTLLDEASSIDGTLIEDLATEGRVAGSKEQQSFLLMLVSAWPNASQGDLAGYGLQLAEDVRYQRPSRYALLETARQLRRSSKFLPSICEVLESIAGIDKNIASAIASLRKMPEIIEKTKQKLLEHDEREASIERRRVWNAELNPKRKLDEATNA